MKSIDINYERWDDWWNSFLGKYRHEMPTEMMYILRACQDSDSAEATSQSSIVSQKELDALVRYCRKNTDNWDKNGEIPIYISDDTFFKKDTLYRDSFFECYWYCSVKDELWLADGELDWIGRGPCRSFWRPEDEHLKCVAKTRASHKIQTWLKEIKA